MKNYEKKSFFITVILFFIPLFVLSSTVLFMYHEEQVKDMEKNILYKMKDYSYDFKGKNFILDIVDYDEKKVLFTIYHVDNSVSAYFETPSKSISRLGSSIKPCSIAKSTASDLLTLFANMKISNGEYVLSVSNCVDVLNI